MRVIQITFDTLTRKFLPNYGCDWVIAPNFKRLEKHCTRFDNFYAGSLPCMPARREMHTGKHNFLHRSWGPLEPFDYSVFEVLKQHGIYTHLVTDHSHYWEDGGCTYHNRYNTWEGFRGQEGDRWVSHDIEAFIPQNRHILNKQGISVKQHYRNRLRQQKEEDMSSVKTIHAGIEFLKEHKDLDNWLLHIECFDPHEPFYVPQNYRDLYDLKEEETLNWPRYGKVASDTYKDDIKNSQKEYAALITMCDTHLGHILDFMDKHQMWEDTALIIHTDHGFLLGEHECLGKNFPPCYDELVHTPFFMHLPKTQSISYSDHLATTVDIPLTILDLFQINQNELKEVDGTSLLPILQNNQQVREIALFGIHGSYTCITDGKEVYIKTGLKDKPFYEYTLMPTNIRGFFKQEQLKNGTLISGDRFSNDIPYLKYPGVQIYESEQFPYKLYNLKEDPTQEFPIIDEELEKKWNTLLKEALNRIHAPKEEFDRLGLK